MFQMFLALRFYSNSLSNICKLTTLLMSLRSLPSWWVSSNLANIKCLFLLKPKIKCILSFTCRVISNSKLEKNVTGNNLHVKQCFIGGFISYFFLIYLVNHNLNAHLGFRIQHLFVLFYCRNHWIKLQRWKKSIYTLIDWKTSSSPSVSQKYRIGKTTYKINVGIMLLHTQRWLDYQCCIFHYVFQ